MPSSKDFIREAERISDKLRDWRRDFHRHPELAFEERRSAKIIADHLDSWGFEVHRGIAQTGLLAKLHGRSDSHGILLRVDMDALPIQEQNEVEYASTNQGVMHACGHDGHMAIGLGVANLMRKHADELDGNVYIIFQPAEEGAGGAARMIAEGVLDEAQVQSALGVHLWNEKPLGWFGISPGSVMAGAERFEMFVHGEGGHGGLPNLTRDPVVAAAAIVSETQSILSRSVDPLDAAVISFTHLRSGSNFNVIPDEVFLEGTIRTLLPSTRQGLIEQFQRRSQLIAEAHDCTLTLEIEQVAPPLVNDQNLAGFVGDLASRLSKAWTIDRNFRVMVSEDMAFFLQEVPGVFVFVGSANKDQGLNSSHHTPTFDFDERAMSNAVGLLCSAIWERINPDD